MATHRIPEGNWELKEDRRRKYDPKWGKSGTPYMCQRSTPHDYSANKYQILEVVMEPHPEQDHYGNWILQGLFETKEQMLKFLLGFSPFSPDDVLVLQDWWVDGEWQCLFDELELETQRQVTMEPPETMPDHLNNFVVGKVIGCEEKLVELEADTTLLAGQLSQYKEVFGCFKF